MRTQRFLNLVVTVSVVGMVVSAAVFVERAYAEVSQASETAVAVVPSQSDADKAMLVSRVEARWRALCEKDYRASYDYELPTYRSANSFEKYRGRFGEAVTWHVATVKEVRYDDPEVAVVSIDLEHSRPLLVGGGVVRSTTPIVETWLKREGQWWHGSR